MQHPRQFASSYSAERRSTSSDSVVFKTEILFKQLTPEALISKLEKESEVENRRWSIKLNKTSKTTWIELSKIEDPETPKKTQLFARLVYYDQDGGYFNVQVYSNFPEEILPLRVLSATLDPAKSASEAKESGGAKKSEEGKKTELKSSQVNSSSSFFPSGSPSASFFSSASDPASRIPPTLRQMAEAGHPADQLEFAYYLAQQQPRFPTKKDFIAESIWWCTQAASQSPPYGPAIYVLYAFHLFGYRFKDDEIYLKEDHKKADEFLSLAKQHGYSNETPDSTAAVFVKLLGETADPRAVYLNWR